MSVHIKALCGRNPNKLKLELVIGMTTQWVLCITRTLQGVVRVGAMRFIWVGHPDHMTSKALGRDWY